MWPRYTANTYPEQLVNKSKSYLLIDKHLVTMVAMIFALIYYNFTSILPMKKTPETTVKVNIKHDKTVHRGHCLEPGDTDPKVDSCLVSTVNICS